MSVMRAVLPKAEVEPLQVPASANFPIAPDGK